MINGSALEPREPQLSVAHCKLLVSICETPMEEVGSWHVEVQRLSEV